MINHAHERHLGHNGASFQQHCAALGVEEGSKMTDAGGA
jgi:hypothetical protein